MEPLSLDDDDNGASGFDEDDMVPDLISPDVDTSAVGRVRSILL